MRVFLSAGSPSTPAQREFIEATEALLRRHGFEPQTPGRNYAANKQPLKAVEQCMRTCDGIVVLAFERIHLVEAVERRGGGAEERKITGVNLPTVWNQVEGAMAYTLGLPLLVIAERGLRSDALLENKYDWNVQWVDASPAALGSQDLLGVLEDWKAEVREATARRAQPQPAPAAAPRSAADQSIADLLGSLRPAQLWITLGALLTALTAAVTTAYKLGAAQASSRASGAPVTQGGARANVADSGVGPVWVSDSAPLLLLGDQVTVTLVSASDADRAASFQVSARGGPGQTLSSVRQGQQATFLFNGREYLLHVLNVRSGAANIKVVPTR